MPLNHSRKGVRIEMEYYVFSGIRPNHSRKGVRIEIFLIESVMLNANHSRKGVRIEMTEKKQMQKIESLPQGSAY